MAATVRCRARGSGRRARSPSGEDRLDPRPGLDLVAAHEQGRVALDDVHQQTLVGVREALGERGGVAQVQRHRRAGGSAGPGLLGGQVQAHALVGLHLDVQPVGRSSPSLPGNMWCGGALKTPTNLRGRAGSLRLPVRR